MSKTILHSMTPMLRATFISIALPLVAACVFHAGSVVYRARWITSATHGIDDGDIEKIVTSHGYVFENHTVITDDGYMLQLHRLYSTSIVNGSQPAPVVFFMHGLFMTSATWLMADSEKALPLRLAARGYDVWLGNARGNRYARRHQHIDPDREPRDFFDFSWHEIAYYDVPKMLDVIGEATDGERVHCVVHSQGGTVVYAMLAERPEYNARIRSIVALAPAVYIEDGFQFVVNVIALAPKFFEWLADQLAIFELLPHSPALSYMAQKYCHDDALFQFACAALVHISCGFNHTEANTTLLPTLFTHTPAGASMKQLLHFAQIKRVGKFQKYDKGAFLNLEAYGQIEPSEYNLTNVVVPSALIYSDNDSGITESDVIKLYNSLSNVDYLYRADGYSHVDFLIGKSNILNWQRIETYLKHH